MKETQFWYIIESFDWTKEGDNNAVMEPAIDILSRLTQAERKEFDEILAEKLYLLDTHAHAVPTGFGVDYFSVDLFLYARCGVLVNGKRFYENILHNPAKMLKELDFEPLLYLTSKAASRAGFEDYDHTTKLSYETFSNEDGWKHVNVDDGLPEGHKPKHQRKK